MKTNRPLIFLVLLCFGVIGLGGFKIGRSAGDLQIQVLQNQFRTITQPKPVSPSPDTQDNYFDLLTDTIVDCGLRLLLPKTAEKELGLDRTSITNDAKSIMLISCDKKFVEESISGFADKQSIKVDGVDFLTSTETAKIKLLNKDLPLYLEIDESFFDIAKSSLRISDR